MQSRCCRATLRRRPYHRNPHPNVEKHDVRMGHPAQISSRCWDDNGWASEGDLKRAETLRWRAFVLRGPVLPQDDGGVLVVFRRPSRKARDVGHPQTKIKVPILTSRSSAVGGDFDGRVTAHAFVFSICSACFREVSVSLAPLNMRATSSVRSSPVIRRTAVRVRSAELFFSIR